MINFGRSRYLLAVVGATVIWGTFSIPLRNLQQYPPAEILHYRLLLSLLIICLVTVLFRRKKVCIDFDYIKSLNRRDAINLLALFVLASIFLVGNWLSFTYVVNHVSLISAAFAYMISPLFTAMIGVFILKEQLSTLKLIAILGTIASVLLLIQGSFLDVLWSILIAVTYAFYMLMQRIITKLDRLNVLGMQLMISTVIVFFASPYLFATFLFPTELPFWINMVIIAAIFTVIPLILVSYSLISLSLSTLGIIIYINPIVAFMIAFLYFGEEITKEQIYAYTLLLASVIVFNWDVLSAFCTKNNKSFNN